MAQDNLKLAQKLFNYTNTHNIPGMMAGNQSKIESMTFNPRYPGFDEQNYRKLESKIDELGLVGNEREKAMDQLYVQVLPQVQNQIINSDRRKYINDAAYEVSQIQNKSDKTQAKSKLTVTELAQQLKEKFNIDPTANDEEVFNSWIESIPNGGQLLADYMNDGDPQLLYQGGLESVPEDVRQKLKDNFWNNLWDNIKTKANVPVDNIKKWGQRTLNNLGAEIYKNILKKTVGDALPEKMGINLDNYVNTFQENAITPRVQENVTDYQNKINQAYAAKEQKNLDQDIKNYYDQKGYTEMLKEGDFRGFLFKSMGDAAQNREMPVVVAASVFQPEVGMALMTTDAYARENQEAFENMMNNGASYEEAEQGAVVVGLVNAAVEVTLEKLIGGVETSASGAIRKTLMKNVQEEAAKKGLGRILLEGVGTQLRASGEEGLEEIVQQIVQNAAVKTVNENQKLFEGVGAAFEGGFYNPMNLLAGGGNLTQNVNQNKDVVRQQIMDGAYNAGQAARTVTDKVGITKNGTNVDVETTETTRNGNGIMDTITDWGAEKITKTSTPQDKLYKAQEPRMNVLSNKKNLENRRANSDRANELIVQNGYVPTSTSERLDAHQATLNKLWGQVMDQVNQGEGVTVDQTPMIDALSEYINSKKKLGVAGIESDIRALESELGSLQKMQEEGTTDLPTLEAKKQVYNDLIDWKGQEASEVYKGGIKLLTQEIGKIEDAMISKIPGEFSSLKKDVGALLDTYEDVFKADMKNQRKKGLGLTETYSRIEGIGDTLGGIFQLFKGDVSGVAKGLGKLALGKSLAKASDADFLIEQGFKELANQQGLNQSQASSKNAKYQVAEEVSPMEEWSIFGLEDENTLHFVEDIQKSLPKKSATNSLPAGYIAAMIDNMKGSMRAKYGRDAVDRLIDLINDASKKETGNGKEYGIGLSSKEFEIWRSKLRERADAGLNQSQASSKTAKYQKYGVAGQGEKGISATEGLNIRNFKNGKTVQELANQYGIDTKIVDSISTPEGQRAYGMYGDRLITLSKDLAESTVPHELLHAVFDMVDQSKRKSILDGVQKKLGVDDVQAEEWLADSFSEYYRTGTFGTQGLAKTFIEKVKQFFYKVKSYIDGTYKNEKQIRQLFDDIIDGKIEGEYGVYSDPRFQTVWHGSPYSFEKFDSAHMGEGEGAQAHGWGHYVAVDENTGRRYAQLHQGDLYSNIKYKGESSRDMTRRGIDREDVNQVAPSDIMTSIVDGISRGKYDESMEVSDIAKDIINQRIEVYSNSYEKSGDWIKNAETPEEKAEMQRRANRLRDLIKAYKDLDEKDFDKPQRNLYEVEIPDPVKAHTPTGNNYLEEDGKITYKQLEKIADGLKDYDQRGERGKERFLEGIIRDLENQKGYWDDKLGKYVIEGDMTGRELYSHLIDFFGGRERGEKTASKFLESLGYDGIHYYGARDGESYVIFNDDALEIKKHEQY